MNLTQLGLDLGRGVGAIPTSSAPSLVFRSPSSTLPDVGEHFGLPVDTDASQQPLVISEEERNTFSTIDQRLLARKKKPKSKPLHDFGEDEPIREWDPRPPQEAGESDVAYMGRMLEWNDKQDRHYKEAMRRHKMKVDAPVPEKANVVVYDTPQWLPEGRDPVTAAVHGLKSLFSATDRGAEAAQAVVPFEGTGVVAVAQRHPLFEVAQTVAEGARRLWDGVTWGVELSNALTAHARRRAEEETRPRPTVYVQQLCRDFPDVYEACEHFYAACQDEHDVFRVTERVRNTVEDVTQLAQVFSGLGLTMRSPEAVLDHAETVAYMGAKAGDVAVRFGQRMAGSLGAEGVRAARALGERLRDPDSIDRVLHMVLRNQERVMEVYVDSPQAWVWEHPRAAEVMRKCAETPRRRMDRYFTTRTFPPDSLCMAFLISEATAQASDAELRSFFVTATSLSPSTKLLPAANGSVDLGEAVQQVAAMANQSNLFKRTRAPPIHDRGRDWRQLPDETFTFWCATVGWLFAIRHPAFVSSSVVAVVATVWGFIKYLAPAEQRVAVEAVAHATVAHTNDPSWFAVFQRTGQATLPGTNTVLTTTPKGSDTWTKRKVADAMLWWRSATGRRGALYNHPRPAFLRNYQRRKLVLAIALV